MRGLSLPLHVPVVRTDRPIFSCTELLGRGVYGRCCAINGTPAWVAKICVVQTPGEASAAMAELLALLSLRQGAFAAADVAFVPQLHCVVHTPATAGFELDFVMDRAPGVTLRVALHTLPFSRLVDTVLPRVLRVLLKTIIELQRLGITHGDIRVDNVMWCDESGRVSLLDWGISCVRGERRDLTADAYDLFRLLQECSGHAEAHGCTRPPGADVPDLGILGCACFDFLGDVPTRVKRCRSAAERRIVKQLVPWCRRLADSEWATPEAALRAFPLHAPP